MAHSPLSDWLRRLESYSPHEIELGLDRVAAVLARMALRPIPRVIHIAGTNGKGSTVAMLRSLLSSTGSIGSYTSPHVSRYNERICIDDRPADDAHGIIASIHELIRSKATIAASQTCTTSPWFFAPPASK